MLFRSDFTSTSTIPSGTDKSGVSSRPDVLAARSYVSESSSSAVVPSSNPSAVSIASTDRVNDLTALITSSASHTSNYLLFPHSTPSASTSTASATPADNPLHGRLSAGAYAGIVIGVVPAIFVFSFFLH